MKFTKDQWNKIAHSRKIAFRRIAEKLGKDHSITKQMGSLAWGRHDCEQGPGGNLQTAIEEASFLHGYFRCLNTWARDNDREAQRIMLDIYPNGMSPAFEKGEAPA